MKEATTVTGVFVVTDDIERNAFTEEAINVNLYEELNNSPCVRICKRRVNRNRQ